MMHYHMYYIKLYTKRYYYRWNDKLWDLFRYHIYPRHRIIKPEFIAEQRAQERPTYIFTSREDYILENVAKRLNARDEKRRLARLEKVNNGDQSQGTASD